MTNFEEIKAMNIEEMAEFIRTMVDDNETHGVAYYGCINFVHITVIRNTRGTNLYECGGCPCEGVGLDIVAWLNLKTEDGETHD